MEKVISDIGGKAKSLTVLNGFVNVPSFCIVPTTVFAAFIVQSGIGATLDSLIAQRDFAQAKKLILSTPLPAVTVEAIRAFTDCLSYDSVSVRSSAVNEDGMAQSFAGQYDSFLFVPNQDIPQYVKNCWASLYNTNVAEYRKGTFDRAGMAVVVQRMIDATKSGIAFSKDPTGHTDAILIESAEGAGENIVSGLITPCRYYVFPDGHIEGNSDLLSEGDVRQIVQCLQKMVANYGCEIDSEWCIDANGELFFLQARPITAVGVAKKPYVSFISRPFSLMRVQLYYLGEFEGIKRLTNGHYYLNPLFIQQDGEVHIYYNNISQKENPPNFFSYIAQNVDMELAYNEAVDSVCRIQDVVFGTAPFEWKRFMQDLVSLYPFSTLGNIVGRMDQSVVKDVRYWLTKFRSQYDKIIWIAEDYLCKAAAECVTDEYKEYVFLEEAFGARPFDPAVIAARKRGYLYFNDQMIVYEDENSFNHFINANNIYLKDANVQYPEDKLIRGSSAYGGRIEGRVRLIRRVADMQSFRKGEIIVSPMTVPQYTQIMKEASGIITDEGGVLCHAAIVARELKIPCVIGCKIATALLKDGDRVIINGDDGIVEILD